MSPASAPIPLLLVADSTDTCERIASALLSAPALYRVERLTAADLSQNGLPGDVQLALVDHELGMEKQARVVQRLNSAGIPVVALVDPRDVQAVQDVVLAGATSLVAVPYADGPLWETVSLALARGARPASMTSSRPGPSHGIVIAMHSPKGGDGTSVLACNLSLALQQRAGRGVALVEAGEGTAAQAILLNLRTERTWGDLLARFDPGDPELIGGVLTEHASGLKILLATPSQSVRIPPDFLDEVVETLQKSYDFVVVDLHGHDMTSVMAVMRMANAALVVVVPEMMSLHHGRLFLEMMEETMPDVRLNIVLNRATLVGGVPTESIRRHLKMQISVEVPDDQPLVTGSVNRGVPFAISHQRSGLARSLQKLARDLAPTDTASVAKLGGKSKAIGPLAWLTGQAK